MGPAHNCVHVFSKQSQTHVPGLVLTGEDNRVTIRSLDESSHIIRSISCNSTINAVCVSKDGR